MTSQSSKHYADQQNLQETLTKDMKVKVIKPETNKKRFEKISVKD